MSRICEVTGKHPMSGHHVSHANNKTKRRFLPNLKKKRFWVASAGRYVCLTVSTKGMRVIDKLGIDDVLAKIAARKKQALKKASVKKSSAKKTKAKKTKEGKQQETKN